MPRRAGRHRLDGNCAGKGVRESSVPSTIIASPGGGPSNLAYGYEIATTPSAMGESAPLPFSGVRRRGPGHQGLPDLPVMPVRIDDAAEAPAMLLGHRVHERGAGCQSQ